MRRAVRPAICRSPDHRVGPEPLNWAWAVVGSPMEAQLLGSDSAQTIECAGPWRLLPRIAAVESDEISSVLRQSSQSRQRLWRAQARSLFSALSVVRSSSANHQIDAQCRSGALSGRYHHGA